MVAQHSPAPRLMLLAIAAACLLARSLDSMWSTSTDLAHHYALVARLSESWNLPYAGDFTLGEMNDYPRSSHIVAAIAGRFLGSALLGLQVTTLLSIVLLWASLTSLLLSLPRNASLVSACVLSAILWLNHRYVHLELHADEVIENFFYAQLIGQAFVISIVALSLYSERAGVNPNLRYALLVAGIYVAAGIHLLPALELMCFFIALVVVDLYRQLSLGKLDRPGACLSVLLVLAAGAALLLHPSFTAMSKLSSNNGAITARYIQSMGAFLAYSCIHVVFSGCVLWWWLSLGQGNRARSWLPLKFIALFGLAVAGLCLLQVLALRLGHGSEYSVKKYIFALNTTLLIELTMVVAVVLCRRESNWLSERTAKLHSVSANLLAPVLTVIAFVCVTPATASLDTSDLVALEHRLLLRRDLAIPDLAGKHSYLVGIDGIPQAMSYMMSIGVLKSPRVATPQTAMPAWWMSDWNLVGTLVTSENSELDKNPACRRAPAVNALVMLDGACVARRFPRRHIVGFTSNHPPTTCATQGFSVAEAIGTWTDGKAGRLRCPLPQGVETAFRSVQIDSLAFLDRVAVQRVIVGIEGQAPVEHRFDAGHPYHLFVLDLPENVGKEVQINFNLPDAISPQQLGLGQDTRQLGMAIRTIEFK